MWRFFSRAWRTVWQAAFRLAYWVSSALEIEFEFLDEFAGLALVELVVEELDRVAVASLGDLGKAQFVAALLVRRLAELVQAGLAFFNLPVGDYEHELANLCRKCS